MRTSARVLSLGLLTTAGLLATTPAHAQTEPATAAVGVGVCLDIPLQLVLGLSLNVDLGGDNGGAATTAATTDLAVSP